MLNLADHAAHFRRVLKLAGAVELVRRIGDPVWVTLMVAMLLTP
jgi:hypothetical protein